MQIVRFADMPAPKTLDKSEAIPDEDLTWERVVEEEPEVGMLMEELRGARRAFRGKPYAAWHAYVDAHGTSPKARLCKLVGWHARDPRLRSRRAYEMTIERMWDLVL